jgi:hypothetical protein
MSEDDVDEADGRIETKGRRNVPRARLRLASVGAVAHSDMGAAETEPAPSTWDHDHCHFCTAKSAPGFPERGYVAPDPRPEPDPLTGASIAGRWPGQSSGALGEFEVWACATCFAELGDYYGWAVVAQ